jgi:hypothetical protein
MDCFLIHIIITFVIHTDYLHPLKQFFQGILYKVIGIMEIGGQDVYIPRLVCGLSNCAISSGGINSWTKIDMYDISDIPPPTTMLGLTTWWSDLSSRQMSFPSFPAEINSAIEIYLGNTQVFHVDL